MKLASAEMLGTVHSARPESISSAVRFYVTEIPDRNGFRGELLPV
jgi:hypothetical protein